MRIIVHIKAATALSWAVKGLLLYYLSPAKSKTSIHRATYIPFLGADDVFDDFFVEVGEHAL